MAFLGGIFGGGEKRPDNNPLDPRPFAKRARGEVVSEDELRADTVEEGRLRRRVEELVRDANVEKHYRDVHTPYDFLEAFIPQSIRNAYDLQSKSLESYRELYALFLRSLDDEELRTSLHGIYTGTVLEILEVLLFIMDISKPTTKEFLNAYPKTRERFPQYFRD